MAKEHTLISNSATVGVLLTLTDNSNYFSECAFWSLPNVSWQIIKKTSGLFDTATKYKSVFLATIKGGTSFVQVKQKNNQNNNVRSCAACSGKVMD